MITNKLFNRGGRLGNQMFQYAALLGIKHKNKYDIVLEDTYVTPSTLYRSFDLKECILSTADNISPNNTYIENCHCFDSNVLEVADSTNLNGYFQTEKYFEHCREAIKQEFVFRETITNQVNSFLEPYRKYSLVSVHIRRTDYLDYSHIFAKCSLDYFNNAMKMLNGTGVYFVITSDDLKWCKDNILLDNVVFSQGNDVYDLCIQSECNHHIISNSTFSWWGAWLGKAPNKKVIAPERWFAEECSLSDEDIVPDYWIKLKN